MTRDPDSIQSRVTAFLRSIDHPLLTKYFTLACFSTPPVLGSLFSFILSGGSLEGLYQVCRGATRLSRDRAMIQLTVAIYLYCTAYLASLFLNPMPAGSLHYFWPVLTFILFPFLYSRWSEGGRQTVARSVVLASMAGCFGAFALAAFQYHYLGIRAEGGAGNAIIFATVTCLAASVCLAGIFVLEKAFSAWLVAAFAAGTMAILYSGSRIIWLVLAINVIAILIVHRDRWWLRASFWMTACVALTIAGTVAVGTEVMPVRINALAHDWQQLSQQGQYDSSLGRRIALWKAAVEIAEEKMLLGHGPQATKQLIRDHFPGTNGLELFYSHFHNGFITAWVEVGLLGMFALAAIFVVAARIAVRTLAATDDPVGRLGASMLLVLVTTYVIGGLTGIIVGHDILDTVLMSFLVVGAFLSSGAVADVDHATRKQTGLVPDESSQQNPQIQSD